MIAFYRNKLFVSFLNIKINEKYQDSFTKSCIVFIKKQTKHLIFSKKLWEHFSCMMHRIVFYFSTLKAK